MGIRGNRDASRIWKEISRSVYLICARSIFQHLLESQALFFVSQENASYEIKNASG